MAWIRIERRHDPQCKRWYCSWCDRRTPIEVNPKWDAAGRPACWDKAEIDFDWFTRCSYCRQQHWDTHYGCDNCGCPAPSLDDDPDSSYLVEMTEPRISSYCSREFGVTGYDWEETWRCPKCRHVYTFGNASW